MTGPSSVTISGPPSTLESLLETSPILLRARRHRLHLTAAYHASHLDICKVDEIIGDSPILDKQLVSNVSVISTNSGEVISTDGGMREVLHRTMTEILQLPIDMSLIIQKLTSLSSNLEVSLSVIGPISASGSIERALKPIAVYDMARINSSDERFRPFQCRPASEAIAIVGMSGRFPKGESLEEFWQVLESGLDLHKEV